MTGEARPPRPRAQPRERVATATPSPGRLTGRFSTASAALAFVGELMSAGQASDSTLLYDRGQGVYWAVTMLPAAAGRELIATCGGRPFLSQADQLVPERGWGALGPLVKTKAERQSARGLTEVTPRDLVRLAGLHSVRPEPLSQALVLLPGQAVAPLVRRALELELQVTHRPVELAPLFDPPGDTAEDAAVSAWMAVELRGRPGRNTEVEALPAAFMAALSNDPLLLLCRVPGEGLLVQYGLAAALTDHQLLTLVPPGQRWLLADAAFGCAEVRDLEEPKDSSGLVRLSDGYRIESSPPPMGESSVEPLPVRIVRASTSGVTVDAVLLDEEDLPVLTLLLQDHRLSDLAWLVRGSPGNLLLAPGGILERLPVGQALWRAGPGALYLQLGHRLSPALPPSARAALFGATAERGIVLLTDHGLEFDLSQARREPVWTLWVGPVPGIDSRLTADTATELQAIDDEFRVPGRAAARPRRRRQFRPATRERTWQDQAFEAEMSGDLPTAARLFESHGESLRAAHLYEAAARVNDR